MERFRVLILLLLAPIVPAFLTGWLHPRRPDWIAATHPTPLVSLATVPAGALWVDAREPAAYAAGHVPGALSLSETHWEQGLPIFIGAWKPGIAVIVYCGSDSCGAGRSVAQRLRRELGIDRVRILEGGWDAWHTRDKP
jgi:rhodanese-related sulfurtransferase